MESKPLSIKLGEREVELLVLYLKETEWVSAAQVATKVMGWNLSSLRRELNQRDWDRLLVKDRSILLKLAQHGALGDSLPGHKCSIGHARSANLIALKSLPELLATLQPKWTECHKAVRYAMVCRVPSSETQ